tara:strand:- start:16 stop:624 length:609 start_codon:yes stop_codon:yes gene_type:complete
MALKPVPKDNKGLGKLPTQVRNKMGYMAKGGRVSFKARPKPMPKSAISKPSRTKPKPGGLGALSTAPKPTTFTGKINTETQKLQNIDGKTVVVNKSNESGRSISDADRSRLKDMMGKRKMSKMNKGGPVRQTIEVKSDKTAGPRGYTQKTSETFYRDKSTGGKFVNTKDKPRKPQGIKMAKGGEVKGGTSSQMSGQHYKGIF